jgi:hypothetical protein
LELEDGRLFEMKVWWKAEKAKGGHAGRGSSKSCGSATNEDGRIVSVQSLRNVHQQNENKIRLTTCGRAFVILFRFLFCILTKASCSAWL